MNSRASKMIRREAKVHAKRHGGDPVKIAKVLKKLYADEWKKRFKS